MAATIKRLEGKFNWSNNRFFRGGCFRLYSLAGFSYNSPGVNHLIAVLQQRPLPTVTVAVAGTASNSNLHFTAKLKLYTQVFTNP